MAIDFSVRAAKDAFLKLKRERDYVQAQIDYLQRQKQALNASIDAANASLDELYTVTKLDLGKTEVINPSLGTPS